MSNILEYTLSLQEKLNASLEKIGKVSDVASVKLIELQGQSLVAIESYTLAKERLEEKQHVLENLKIGFAEVQNSVQPFADTIKAIGEVLGSLEGISFKEIKQLKKSLSGNSLEIFSGNSLRLGGFSKKLSQKIRKISAKGIKQLKEGLSGKSLEIFSGNTLRLGGFSKKLSQGLQKAKSVFIEFQTVAVGAGENTGVQWGAMTGSITSLLEKVTEVKEKLLQPFIELANITLSGITSGLDYFLTKLDEGDVVITSIALVLGTFMSGLILYNNYLTVSSFLQNKLTKSIIKSSLAFLSSPVTWVVLGVVSLIAVIGFLIAKIDGWGQAWQHTVKGAGLIWEAFVEGAKAYFATYVEGFMIGINKIQEGWYRFQNLIGAGDKEENNAAIEKLKKDTDARQKIIADGYKKAGKLAKEAQEEFALAAGSLKFNDKNLKDVVGDLKEKLGISVKPPNELEGKHTTNTHNKEVNEVVQTNNAIATGGTRNNNITINLKDLIGVLNIEGSSFNETTNQMEEATTDSLLRVLALASTASN